MAKTGIGVKRIVDEVENQFRQWQNKASALQTLLDAGQNVSIDKLALDGYHDARRSLETFDLMQARIVAKAWVVEVRAEGVARHGAGYDIVAEAQTFRTLLSELQTEIITAVGGVDADGYIQANYIKLSNTAPFFNVVTPANYAAVNTKLQEISAAIED